MRQMKCPNCGASLSLDDKHKSFAFCSYCGTRIDFADKRVEYRIVNEAKMQKEEARAQRNHELIEWLKQETSKEDAGIFGLIGVIILCIIMAIFAIIIVLHM